MTQDSGFWSNSPTNICATSLHTKKIIFSPKPQFPHLSSDTNTGSLSFPNLVNERSKQQNHLEEWARARPVSRWI